jgi:hypothetical protein
MAAAAVRHPVRSSLPLPLWTKPRTPTVAAGDVGESLCSCHLAGGLSASWYVGFGNYNKTHGSLGAVIAFMICMWLSAIIILIGAEDQRGTPDRSRHHRRRRQAAGLRRATMTDEVGQNRRRCPRLVLNLLTGRCDACADVGLRLGHADRQGL